MSYLTIQKGLDEKFRIPLRAIDKIVIPNQKGNIVHHKKDGDYVITVNYKEREPFEIKFYNKCWEEVEEVVKQLKQVVRPSLFKMN